MSFKIVGDQIRALQKSIGLAPHALAYRQSDGMYRHTTPEELAELANQHIDAFSFTPAKFKLFLARAAWKSNGFREAYVRTGEDYPPVTFGQIVGEGGFRPRRLARAVGVHGAIVLAARDSVIPAARLAEAAG